LRLLDFYRVPDPEILNTDDPCQGKTDQTDNGI
jgi:hypothetical protein